MKNDDEYWYYFGKCIPFPKQISKGTKPIFPYLRFDSKEECQKYIDSKKPFDAYKMIIKNESRK